MRIARTLTELQDACRTGRSANRRLALVPTMGALHDGHRALVHAAVASDAFVIASIFVNPAQFAATEDLSLYPRDEAGDIAFLEDAGCALLWMPDVATIYPADDATTISVSGPSENWESAARPGHFRGVATVCAKLFGQTWANKAYFGEKDWQQLQVVRRMVSDLHLPLEIVAVETIREPDGLAMSSRNRFLSATERERAPLLYRVLEDSVAASRTDSAAALRTARERLTDAGFSVDYFALVDGPSLREIPHPAPNARIIAAARLGTVRLLDNIAA